MFLFILDVIMMYILVDFVYAIITAKWSFKFDTSEDKEGESYNTFEMRINYIKFYKLLKLIKNWFKRKDNK